MESEFRCYYMSAMIFQPNIFLVIEKHFRLTSDLYGIGHYIKKNINSSLEELAKRKKNNIQVLIFFLWSPEGISPYYPLQAQQDANDRNKYDFSLRIVFCLLKLPGVVTIFSFLNLLNFTLKSLKSPFHWTHHSSVVWACLCLYS